MRAFTVCCLTAAAIVAAATAYFALAPTPGWWQ